MAACEERDGARVAAEASALNIPHHVFSPSNMSFPYAKEIDRYMVKPGLIIHESDVEVAQETFQRFQTYIWNTPDRIHSCPYLCRVSIEEDKQDIRLVWVNRFLAAKTWDMLPRKVKKKIVYYMPGGTDASKVIITADIPLQGGEPESEYYGLGLTYIPYGLWQRIREQVIDIDWLVLDSRVSMATAMIGQRALIHWNCLANHNSVLGTEKEFLKKYGLTS